MQKIVAKNVSSYGLEVKNAFSFSKKLQYWCKLELYVIFGENHD